MCSMVVKAVEMVTMEEGTDSRNLNLPTQPTIMVATTNHLAVQAVQAVPMVVKVGLKVAKVVLKVVMVALKVVKAVLKVIKAVLKVTLRTTLVATINHLAVKVVNMVKTAGVVNMVKAALKVALRATVVDRIMLVETVDYLAEY